MVKLKDLLYEGKFTVDFDIGSPGIMSQTVDAKNAKEAAKKVAAGIKGKVKIKKVYKAKPIKLKSKSGMGKISHLGIESVKEKLGMGDEYRDFAQSLERVHEVKMQDEELFPPSFSKEWV